MPAGKLYLIPVPLSGGEVESLSADSIHQAHTLTNFVVERAKPARAFLKSILHPVSLQQIEIHQIPEKYDALFFKMIIEEIRRGKDMGLLSEAGLPCIADPGADLVQLAHKHQIKVVPYPGPNSMMMALMASGLDAQQFQFHGYLPAKKDLLRDQLIRLINEIKKTGTTQIFMETPYRNKQVLEMIKHNIPADFHFCVASSLSTKGQIILTKKIKDWKEEELKLHYDRPAVFLIGK